MKTLITLLAGLALNAFSATFTVIGPCEEEPLFRKHIFLHGPTDVGTFTIQTLEAQKIPHQGSQMGINSIYNTPLGLDSMEILSDTELLAYGWCYSVNGIEPRNYPNNVVIQKDDNVVWWYGYAHYFEGEWISQCRPSHIRRPSQFCE